MEKKKPIATKFNKEATGSLESLMNSTAYQLRLKLNEGGKFERKDKDWLTEAINTNSYFKKSVPVMGWKFDFSDVINTFVVKQNGAWSEYNAVDRTSLRQILHGKIDMILDVPEE